MATITRVDVISRANTAWQQAGYFYGGNYTMRPSYMVYTNGRPYYSISGTDGSYFVAFNSSAKLPYLVPQGQYYACDCSAFCSWCWAVARNGSTAWSQSGQFGGSRFRSARSGSYSSMEEKYPGIQQGDVLYKKGHVALYYGNNQCIELAQSDWTKTQNGHGGNIRFRDDFIGYCSFDGSFSTDYPEDDPDVPPVSDWDPDAGYTGDDSQDGAPTGDLGIEFILANEQYTRKYWNMKAWRLY